MPCLAILGLLDFFPPPTPMEGGASAAGLCGNPLFKGLSPPSTKFYVLNFIANLISNVISKMLGILAAVNLLTHHDNRKDMVPFVKYRLDTDSAKLSNIETSQHVGLAYRLVAKRGTVDERGVDINVGEESNDLPIMPEIDDLGEIVLDDGAAVEIILKALATHKEDEALTAVNEPEVGGGVSTIGCCLLGRGPAPASALLPSLWLVGG